jgi:hypothetical protein
MMHQREMQNGPLAKQGTAKRPHAKSCAPAILCGTLRHLNVRAPLRRGTLTKVQANGASMTPLHRSNAVPDLTWLAVLVGLTLLTLGFVRLCDAS